jgi:hypothetical protein
MRSRTNAPCAKGLCGPAAVDRVSVGYIGGGGPLTQSACWCALTALSLRAQLAAPARAAREARRDGRVTPEAYRAMLQIWLKGMLPLVEHRWRSLSWPHPVRSVAGTRPSLRQARARSQRGTQAQRATPLSSQVSSCRLEHVLAIQLVEMADTLGCCVAPTALPLSRTRPACGTERRGAAVAATNGVSGRSEGQLT